MDIPRMFLSRIIIDYGIICFFYIFDDIDKYLWYISTMRIS